MSKTTQGVLALVVFGLLVLFFIAAWATATKSVAQNGSSTPGGVIVAPTAGGVISPLAAPNPAAAAVGSTPAAGQPIRYTVQAGEWLRAIALRYGTTVDAILAINPQITDPDQLTPGQEILIPSAAN